MPAPRIAPLEPPFPPEVAAELARWMPPGAAVPPLALFRTLARDLPLAQAMRELGRFLLGRRLQLPLRTRELVIARVCARAGCEYEWGVHAAAFGAAAQLDPATLDALVTAPADDPRWAPGDAAALRFVDALDERAAVSDGVWDDLAGRFSAGQLLELVVLVGWYQLIARIANVTGVPLEPWARRFPTDPSASAP